MQKRKKQKKRPLSAPYRSLSMAVVILCVLVVGKYLYPSFPFPNAQQTATVLGIATNQIQSDGILLVQNSLDSADPLSKIDAKDPYSTLAYYGMVFAKASILLKESNPTKANQYLSYATRIGDYLVLHKDDNADGKVGWGLAYAWDAFQDSTTNPAFTPYAFQDGLVGNALLDIYQASNNPVYVQTVVQELNDYLPHGTSTINSSCQSCFYFYYSADKNDAGKLVKNTNMLMGLVAARAGKLAHNPLLTATAQKVYNAELYEVQLRKNYKYLGYDDPRYNTTSNPLDAHIVLETWAFTEIAKSLNQPQNALVNSMVATFWQCGKNCLSDTQTIYTDFTNCYSAELSLSYDTCEKTVLSYTQAAKHMSSFPLLGLTSLLTTLSPTPLSPTITPTPPVQNPADLNRDGRIDVLDYNILYSCFGKRMATSTCLDLNKDHHDKAHGLYSDLDANGIIDGIDYNIWFRIFIQASPVQKI